MTYQYPPSPLSTSIPLVACPSAEPDGAMAPSIPTQQYPRHNRSSLRDNSLSPRSAISSVSPLTSFPRRQRHTLYNMTAHPETESSTRSASSPVLAWKVGHHANSPQPINVKSPNIYGHHIDSHFQHPSSDQSSGRPHFHPGAQKSGQVLNLAARRRQSRYDPMGREEELDEEGYGELGHRHPLRRVAEEDAKEDGSVSLPGIKSLFGVAGGELAVCFPLTRRTSTDSIICSNVHLIIIAFAGT